MSEEFRPFKRGRRGDEPTLHTNNLRDKNGGEGEAWEEPGVLNTVRPRTGNTRPTSDTYINPGMDIPSHKYPLHGERDSADPYERDGSGRPIGFKKGGGSIVRRRAPAEGVGLKPYLILGGLFTVFLLATGEFLIAGLVGGTAFIVYAISRYRR